MKWFYPVFKKTILTGQYVGQYVDRSVNRLASASYIRRQ